MPVGVVLAVAAAETSDSDMVVPVEVVILAEPAVDVELVAAAVGLPVSVWFPLPWLFHVLRVVALVCWLLLGQQESMLLSRLLHSPL